MLKKIIQPLDRKLLTIIGIWSLALLLVIVMGGCYLHRSGDDFVLSTIALDSAYKYFKYFITAINGRFSYGFVSFITYQSPDVFIKLTPIFFISLFTSGFYLLIRRLVGREEKWLLLCLGFIFTLGLAMIPANQYQTFYWLPSFIAYGLPLSLLLFFLTYTLMQLKRMLSYLSLLATFVSAVFIGGLHEQVSILGASTLCTMLLLIIANAVLVKKVYRHKAKLIRQAIILLVPCIGFAVAFSVNYLLPVTVLRRSMSQVPLEGIQTTLSLSLEFSIKFFESVLINPAVIFCLFSAMLFSFIIYKKHNIKDKINEFHSFSIYLAVLALISFPFLTLFVTAVMARYGYGSAPPDRSIMPFYFTLLLSAILTGVLLPALCSLLSKKAIMASRAFVIMILILIAPIMFHLYTQKTAELYLEVKSHSRAFEQREEYIKWAVSNGQKDVYVPSIPIGDTPYPTADKNTWVNKGLAKFYKLDSLTAY